MADEVTLSAQNRSNTILYKDGVRFTEARFMFRTAIGKSIMPTGSICFIVRKNSNGLFDLRGKSNAGQNCEVR